MTAPTRIVPVQTEDGSWTLFDQDLGVHYRSIHGATTEAQHVFLQGTRLLERPGPWRVLEFGFGSGVNFTQTMAAALDGGVALEYHAVELRPVASSLLGHLEGRPGELAREAMRAAVGAEAGEQVEVHDGAVALTVHVGPWHRLKLAAPFLADAYYHDPFGPKINPQGWTPEVFKWARALMHDQGILATYSSAGAPKRAMHQAGFRIGWRPGPGLKREVTVASPTASRLAHATLYPPLGTPTDDGEAHLGGRGRPGRDAGRARLV